MGMARVGSHLWICNLDGNSITEIDATSGRIVRTLSSRSYHFDGPIAIATNGRTLWVANSQANSVTELNGFSGSLLRVIDPTKHKIYPQSLAFGDGHVWVAGGGNVNHTSEVVELNASSGDVVRVVTKDVWSPQTLNVIGGNVWIGNESNGAGESGGTNHSVVELDAATGGVERTINMTDVGVGVQASSIQGYGGDIWLSNGNSEWPGTNYPMIEIRQSDGAIVRKVSEPHKWSTATFGLPDGIAINRGVIWVTDWSNVVELSASTGAVLRILGARQDHFNGAENVVVIDGRIWVANQTGNSLTELNASNGSLIRVIG